MLDRDAARRVLRDLKARQLHGLIVRVVQDLDLQPIAWIIEGADRIDEALDHAALVVNRELHGDRRPGRRPTGRQRARAPPLVQVHQPTAVQAERCQPQQSQRVGGEHELGNHLMRTIRERHNRIQCGSAKRRSITLTDQPRHYSP